MMNLIKWTLYRNQSLKFKSLSPKRSRGSPHMAQFALGSAGHFDLRQRTWRHRVACNFQLWHFLFWHLVFLRNHTSQSVSGDGMSSDDEHYQLLQTAKFSIRSPRARVAKRVQQELVRAGERRQRRAPPAGKMPVMRPRRPVQEAHKYLPQCDQVMQNAVDLYIAR